MRVPAFNAATAGLGAELQVAERQRDALPHGGSIEAALHAAGLDVEEVLRYPVQDYPLREILTDVLGLSCELDALHNELPHFSPGAGSHREVMRRKTELLQPLTDVERAAAFIACYDALVLDELAPQLARALSRAESPPSRSVYYAATPTVRVQQPSHLRQIRPHCDGIYGLQEGALNFWLPLTEVESDCTLHVESTPGARDFHPLLPRLGELVRFNGRRCVHYTTPNSAGRTRVSLDFRCVIGDHWDPRNRLARCGYFSEARLNEDGRYVKVRGGHISELHGLPYTGRARVQ